MTRPLRAKARELDRLARDGVRGRGLQRRGGQRPPRGGGPPRAWASRALAVTADSASLAEGQRALARDLGPRFRVRPPGGSNPGVRRPRLRAQRRAPLLSLQDRALRRLLPLARDARASPTSPTASSWTTSPTSAPASRRPREAGVRAPSPRPASRRTTCGPCRAPWPCPPPICPRRPACPRGCPTERR